MACTAAALNAARNGIEVTCTTDDLIGRDDATWEVILVGDLFYDAEVSIRVLPWLRTLVKRGAMVLVGDPFRGNVPGECVEALAHYDAPFDTDVRGLHLRRTQVVRLLGGSAQVGVAQSSQHV
jgi:predicted nicotinamide N-methyase